MNSPDLNAPRPHHYVLAHIALRKACQGNPFAFFTVMGSPHRDDFLGKIWQHVREHCDKEGTPAFDISDVGITVGRVKGFPSIVVAMPPPAAVAEAHFVAVVLKLDPETTPPPEQPEFAYLTLEKGINMDGTDRTVLCGWTGDDSHVNYGTGPAATQEDFIAAVEGLL